MPGMPQIFLESRDWVRLDPEKVDEQVSYYKRHSDEAIRIADAGHRVFLKTIKAVPRESLFLSGRNYFFIVGSQRSGTTLLEFILSSHPDIAVFGEPGSYDKLGNRNPEPRDKVLGFKIPSWTFRYEYFKRHFPNVKIIFMERDILQVTASMVALKEWIPQAMEGELASAISGVRDPVLRASFRQLHEKHTREGKKYLSATLCAFLNRSHVLEYEKSGLNLFRVDYEKLVSSPRVVIESILTFLKTDWNDVVLNHHSCHSGVYTGQNNSERPISPDSLKKWERVLSKTQVFEIQELINSLPLILKA